MEMLHLVVGYLVFVAFMIFILLFGESPVFLGTPISGCHWCITTAPLIFFEWCIYKCCGAKGNGWISWVEDIMCNRRNPLMQVMYLFIWIACYYFFYRDLFPMLPGKYIGAYHIITGSIVACSCLIFFYLSCVSDPGTVAATNCQLLEHYFPFDNAIFSVKKDCSTCGFTKPARSKHCSSCNRCVARYDHHCGWISNCVGLNNHRYFLGFILANLLAAVYGSVAIACVVYGDIENVIWRPIQTRRHKVVYLGRNPSILFEWLLIRYPVLTLLFFVSVVLAVLMLGFVGFHLFLIASGKTTNESLKWADLHREMIDRGDCQTIKGWLPWSKKKIVKLPRNIYNRGFMKNLHEILVPSHYMQDFQTAELKDSRNLIRQKEE